MSVQNFFIMCAYIIVFIIVQQFFYRDYKLRWILLVGRFICLAADINIRQLFRTFVDAITLIGKSEGQNEGSSELYPH